MPEGYIKLWRKSLEDSLWQNISIWRLFEYCLLKATYREHTVLVGMQEINLKPGQFVFGRKVASEESGLSERTIRTCMEKLKNMRKLTIKTTNKFSIITIVNWGRYQTDEIVNDQQNDQQATNKRPTSDHIQERKERIRKERINTYSADFESFWKAYPNKTGKKPAWEKWQKINSRRPQIEVILSAIEKQKQCRKWKEGYIPNPLTWVNQERWTDEPIEESHGTDIFDRLLDRSKAPDKVV